MPVATVPASSGTNALVAGIGAYDGGSSKRMVKRFPLVATYYIFDN
jgi:hypothetical protein